MVARHGHAAEGCRFAVLAARRTAPTLGVTTSMRGIKLSRILLATSALLFAVVIGFRAFVYTKLYIAEDEPFGISDVIELLLGSLLILAFATSALTALFLAIRGQRESRVAAAWLAGSIVVMAALLDPMHLLAAQWSSR